MNGKAPYERTDIKNIPQEELEEAWKERQEILAHEPLRTRSLTEEELEELRKQCRI